jgi:hypothetical protein
MKASPNHDEVLLQILKMAEHSLWCERCYWSHGHDVRYVPQKGWFHRMGEWGYCELSELRTLIAQRTLLTVS